MSIKTRTSGIMVNINVEPTTTGWAGVTSGLTHHWPMDDTDVLNDIVGGLNGTATGAGVTSAVGPSGGAGTARQFDGVDSITLGGSPYADFLNDDVTICVWIYTPSVTSGTSPYVFNWYDGTVGLQCSYENNIPAAVGGQCEFGSAAGGGPPGPPGYGTGNNTPPNVLVNNTWLHFAITHVGGQATNLSLLYVDGSAVSGAYFGPGENSVTTNVIATRGDGGAHLLPNGNRLGRIVTYNRILSAAEILQNFNAK